MNDPAHNLKLTDSSAPAFDDRLWRWQLRDSGLLRRMRPAASKVLWFAYAFADHAGECDLPQRWLAEATGYAPRWVRQAVAELEQLRLLEMVGASKLHPQIRRYRLVMPDQGAALRHPGSDNDGASDPESGAKPGNSTSGGGEVQCRDPGSGATKTPEVGAPQSSPKAEEESRRSRARGAEPAAATLWHAPGYDRAAAAALSTWGGLSWRVAHGLITQYRPTRRQVLHVLANAFGWRRAHRHGDKAPLRDLKGFVHGELRRGSYALDDRVKAFRAARRQQASPKRPATPAAKLDAMPADQREQLAEQVIAELRPQSRQQLEALPAVKRAARIRELMIDELKQQTKEAPREH